MDCIYVEETKHPQTNNERLEDATIFANKVGHMSHDIMANLYTCTRFRHTPIRQEKVSL